jgi:2-polyprenyl-3-methyl-5-hydroxy-6-metoxy-1,4-benzoquinol methylase
MRIPALLHPLLGRSPDFSHVDHAICMGSGSLDEVDQMVVEVKKILPRTKIRMVAQPECQDLDIAEWIDIRTVEKSAFASLRGFGRTKPDLVIILLNGKWTFWRQWLFGALLRAHHCLVVDEHGDAFFLRPRTIPRLMHTLFLKEHGGRRLSLGSGFLETLTKIAGLPLLFLEAMVMEASRRKANPTFALALPGQFDWNATQVLDACFQMGEARDANTEEELDDQEDMLDFTGGHFVPGIGPNLEIENYSRYSFANRFVDGKRVLDARCGEGYGIASLARTAQEAVGIDVSVEVIESARSRYRQPNLDFRHVLGAEDYPFPDRHFDVVTSFEVIELISNRTDYLEKIARVLSDAGILILSSPNWPCQRDEQGEIKALHKQELGFEELDRILAIHFPHRKMFGQNHHAGILIEDFQKDQVHIDARGSLTGRELGNAHYLLAVCSRSPLPEIDGLCYPSFRGNQMRERERQIAFLQQELLSAKDAYGRLASEFEERDLRALSMQREIEELRSRLKREGQ